MSKDPIIEFKLEQEILEAAKNVARTEDIMYQKEQEYQIAYDDFKIAQQALHEAQRAWFNSTNTETGILSPVSPEGSSPDVYDASASS